MSTLSRVRRRAVMPAVLVSALVAAAPFVAGCADGQNAPTRLEYSVTDGVMAHAGNVVLRDLLLTADTQVGVGVKTLDLQGIVDNNTGADDLLTGVSAASQLFTPSSATPSAAPSASAPSASSASVPADVAPGSPVNLGTDGLGLSVSDLPAAVVPGSVVELTFSFRTAGDVTVAVPVYTLASRQPGAAAPSGPVTFPSPDVPEGFNESAYDVQPSASS